MYYKKTINSPKCRFTYNNSYLYTQSPPRKEQVYTFQRERDRTGSLPPSKHIPQSKVQNNSHIKILEESFNTKRMRKHKIFQQQSPIDKSIMSKQRRRSRTIFGQYKRNSRQKSNQRDSSAKEHGIQSTQVKYQEQKVSSSAEKFKLNNQSLQEMSISQLNRVIDRKILQRISVIDSRKQPSMRQQVDNDQILRKQQQIIYLKMQVQRLKRCENLNKQNQSLYKKLVIKLKEYTKRSKSLISQSPKKVKQIQTSPNKELNKQTPIKSLCDLKKTDQSVQQKTNGHSRKTLVKEQLSPKKNILSPQELFTANRLIQTKMSEIITNHSQPMTFNNTKEIGKQRMHSKRLKIQTFPNMRQVKQQILYSQLGKQTLSQIPVQSRLLQINNQLERRMSYRSASKNKYQTKTTTNFYTPNTLVYSRHHTNHHILYY